MVVQSVNSSVLQQSAVEMFFKIQSLICLRLQSTGTSRNEGLSFGLATYIRQESEKGSRNKDVFLSWAYVPYF